MNNPKMDIFNDMNILDLLKLRETSIDYRDIVNNIINERHFKIFGKKGKSKTLALKIKDITLNQSINKLTNSLFDKNGALYGLSDAFWDYGLLCVTGKLLIETIYIHTHRCLKPSLATWGGPAGEYRDFSLTNLIIQRDALYKTFPKLRYEITNGYYNALNSAINNKLICNHDGTIRPILEEAKLVDPLFKEDTYNIEIKKGIITDPLKNTILDILGYTKLPENLKKFAILTRPYGIKNLMEPVLTLAPYVETDYDYNLHDYLRKSYKNLKFIVESHPRLSNEDRGIIKEYTNYRIKNMFFI